MRNPIIETRNLQVLFLSILILMTIGRIFHFVQIGVPDWTFIIIDALLIHFTLAGLGLGLWFAIVFNSGQRGIYNLLIFHLVLGIILIGGWLFLNKLILNLLFSGSEVLSGYIKSSTLLNLVTAIVFYLVLALSYYLAIFNHDLEVKIKNESQLESLVKEAELGNLKKQINPHFMFNSLNSISALTLVDPEKAREMIASLSEFLRYGLKENLDRLVSLDHELANIQRYLAIEKIRFGEKLKLHQEINPEAQKLLIPQLILQPLLENAIKFGVYEATEQVFIKISATYHNHTLFVEVENSFDPESRQAKGDGVGLNNIRERLKLIYNRVNLMKVNKTDHIFKVTLIIPQT